MLNTRRIFAGFLTAAAIAAAPASWAAEPANDAAPWTWRWYNGETTIYSAPPGGINYNSYEAISSSTDVDHIILACGTGKVQSITINFAMSSGHDLDMAVYDLSGNFIGSSTGVTNSETVNVSAANKQAIVMKVYGWQGSTNPYDMVIVCG